MAALAACASALARSGSAERGATASSSGSQLHVTQVEYRLLLSHATLKAGPVNLEAVDRGVIPHDLRLQAEGSRSVLAVPELAPGRGWDGTVNLRPGVYRLWCSLPEHARLGMRATLTVVR